MLDALAELSISDREVVAVALRIHEGAPERPVPELIISANNPPINIITAHLTSIWTLLRKLSDEKFKNRFPKAALWERSPALDMTEARLQTLYNQIFHETYRHSYIKLQRRYNKHWQLLELFFSRHRVWTQQKQVDQQEKENENEGLFGDFCWLRATIRQMNDALLRMKENGWPIETAAMAQFKALWEKALTLASRVLEDVSACEEWEKRVISASKFGISIFRIIC